MVTEPLIIPTREEIQAGLQLECLEAPQVWKRPKADFVVDLSGLHLEHALSGEQPQRRHGAYRNHFSDVLLFGYHHFHGILTKDLRIYCQAIDAAQYYVDIHILHHPGRDAPIPQIYRGKRGYRVNFDELITVMLPGSLYFGTPVEPLNWGMWLLQAIPSAIDFLSNCQAERFFAYIGRDWQRQLLNALGIPNDRLLHQDLCCSYHCDDLILKQFSDMDLAPTPGEREVFAQVARDVAGVRHVGGSRRLFVSRLSVTKAAEGNYRALLNEDALVEALSARGYDIVEPELLTFAEQVRLFAEATLVVGLGGAGLFNVVFCASGTRVVTIESSTAFVHSHACLFGALGHPYGVIFGRQDSEDQTPVQKRWTIDVEGTVRALSHYE